MVSWILHLHQNGKLGFDFQSGHAKNNMKSCLKLFFLKFGDEFDNVEPPPCATNSFGGRAQPKNQQHCFDHEIAQITAPQVRAI